MDNFEILYNFFNFEILKLLNFKFLTPYRWYIDPPTHGISTPLPMVFWPPYPWYIDPLPMVFWTPYPWYIDPHIHGSFQ
jgi:hypothetical protein